MEGSSGSSWQNSENLRTFNTAGMSDWNLRGIASGGSALSGQRSHNSGSRKPRDRFITVQGDNHKFTGRYSGICVDELVASPFVGNADWHDVSLRQWLDKPDRAVDDFECLHIFRQIVEIVNVAHYQGIVVHNVRPSCFVMSSFNHVSFIESASNSDSSSESLGEGLHSQTVGKKNPSSIIAGNLLQQGRARGGNILHTRTPKAPLSEMSYMESTSFYAARASLVEQIEENKFKERRNIENVEGLKQPFPMKQILQMESSWYTSPEEVAGASSSCASDIYCLGVLLFELFCPVNSRDEKSRIMSSLRHRVLPPQLLLKWPKEASFCLWLLHPEPSGRPTLGDLLHSEFLNEQRDDIEDREAVLELRHRLEEQELLLEFLLLIHQRKQDSANKLQQTLAFLCSDIEVVDKQHLTLKEIAGSSSELGTDDHSSSDLQSMTIVDGDDSACLGTRRRVRPRLCNDRSNGSSDNLCNGEKNGGRMAERNYRLMKNFKKLESVYFMTRGRSVNTMGNVMVKHLPATASGRGGSVVATERSSVSNFSSNEHYSDNKGDWINPFLEGLCKYLSFTKLDVKADLVQGDLLNSSNLVCSISFDRDGEFFATAGVNKKIKVFECEAIIKEKRDIHYPVVEMACKSKLSSICWNTYIKSQIASSNFEGLVQVWDVTKSQLISELHEHERRVWSVDFSSADPTMLASGSDDFSVKLWNTNQAGSVGTIKTKANVCCVQFAPDSSRHLAFGSADHKIYYYDLRNSKMPLSMLVAHSKTVSYVKFVDSMNLISSSTDNSLKLWDLSMSGSRIVDTPVQSFSGHLNLKNFVGLSVCDGYIATGSETNEVVVYYKGFPMPAVSFKFQNTDPVSGYEMDDQAQFISSVCWRGHSSTLVAANSTGHIKILEMV